jgi:hypothetical protein|tara:strand:- start:575 stop:877 length:303 start_codon:yes stop_codon:yes gene_type:complete
MLLRNIISNEEDIIEEGLAWAKSGGKVVRKYRCVGGQRNGRIVASPGQCYARIDIKKRQNLKRTKARLGKKITRKAQRTKKTNSTSKRVKSMNKSAGRKR